MKKINLSNNNKRDALLGFEAKPTRQKVFQVLENGQPKSSVKLLKSTDSTSFANLQKEYSDAEELANAIINTDIDVDIEKIGKKISGLKKVYANQNGQIAMNVKLLEIVKDNTGETTEKRDLVVKDANISVDKCPIKWSGKTVPKKMAGNKFVFAKHYQIKHVNGLTYDFLYEMAKELHEKDSLMFVGAGEKGNEPLLVAAGGTPYRGFLEGRIDGDKYMLLLHLTNLELKEFTK